MNLMDLAAVRRAQAALNMVGDRPLPSQFSFARLVTEMSAGGLRSGVEFDALQEVAERAGKPFDPARPTIPWELLAQRDLSTATGSGGGFLVSSKVLAAQDVLRPYSVVTRLGVTVMPGQVGNAELPKTVAKSTPYWIDGVEQQLTESMSTLGSVAMTPKTAGAFVQFSRNFSKQANAEAFVRRELLRTVGDAVDAGVIGGTGLLGQPLGILNVPGINTTSGSSIGQAGAVEMKRKVSDANAPDEGIAYIATPAVRELLEKRERATGLGFVWDGNTVASRPAAVSTSIPASTMICAHWPSIHLLLWGAGFEFQLNPYDGSGFKSGRIDARVLVSCDVAALHPATICVASSIS